jgi:exosome complex component RRP4
LNLNSAYITEQRKKNQEDEFNMRKIMQEDDYIVAEVQTANADKTYNLHTRNPKYGKLEPGILIEVSHKLIKKQKHHFITFSAPWSPESVVGIVLGNNGNIWLSGLNRNIK